MAARSAKDERARRRGAWHWCRPPFFSGDEVVAARSVFTVWRGEERRGVREK
jgi:hypothetical protein